MVVIAATPAKKFISRKAHLWSYFLSFLNSIASTTHCGVACFMRQKIDSDLYFSARIFLAGTAAVLFMLLFFVQPLCAAQPFLKLEPVFEGTTPLYPGQTASLGYRYVFNTSIDLLEEKLPLLEAKGFKKLGDKQIKEGEEKGVSVRQVTQKIEAIEPGEFLLGPSVVSGYAYTLDKSGNKQHQKPLLKAELPLMRITVAAFPTTGKPGSFRGAIGQYTFQAKLLSSPTISVGEKIKLILQVQGKGYFNTLLPPELCCQPGFSGFFKESDLPPVTETKADEKTFVLELFLANSAAKTIPPIEFSFFDPVSKSYKTAITQEIPLQVSHESLSPLVSSLSLPVSSNNMLLPFPQGSGDAFEKARLLYQEGTQEINPQAFNQALSLLLPLPHNASVDSAIGTLLLQLQEKPLAIYYFKRALKEDPAFLFPYERLKELVPETTLPKDWRKPFFISLSFFSFTLLAYLWLGPPLWKWFTLITALPLLLTGFLLLSAIYFSPLEAVLLKSTLLYQGPDEKYPPIDLQPIPSGSIVTVLDTEKQGNWIKVRSNSRLGFVPQKAIRLVP